MGVELRCDALDAACDLGVGGRGDHTPPLVGNGAGSEDDEVSPGSLLAHLAGE